MSFSVKNAWPVAYFPPVKGYGLRYVAWIWPVGNGYQWSVADLEGRQLTSGGSNDYEEAWNGALSTAISRHGDQVIECPF